MPVLGVVATVRRGGGPATVNIGIAVETDFTTGDPFADSVVLISNFEGVDGSTISRDESLKQHGFWTFGGTAQIDTAQSNTGASSLLLDGNSDEINLPDSTDWTIGAGEFTLEASIRFNSLPAAFQCIASHYLNTGNQRAFLWQYDGAGGEIEFQSTSNGTTFNTSIIGSWSPSINTWYDLCVERDASNNMRIYVDGAVVAGPTSMSSNIFNSNQVFRIGALNSSGLSRWFNGWIDNVRFTKVARYGGAYTPNVNDVFFTYSITPQKSGVQVATETDTPIALTHDPNFDSVVFLCNFDGSDAATSATDDSNSAHTITFNGNAQLDTAQSKFGSASLLCDGSGDYVSCADSADWDLSNVTADEFTVELWFRKNANIGTGFGWLIGQWDTGGNDRCWGLTLAETAGGLEDNRIEFYWSNAGNDFDSVVASSQGDLLGAWHALAVDKDSSGKVRIYLDGSMVASGTPSDPDFFGSGFTFRVGQDSNTDRSFDGWIDEVRVTKGVARYASDSGYTVPTEAFPRSSKS